ncbi:rhomboid family intramembrane serine protease [Ferruginibacter sp. HRS2-29]|uniref:rhomboid family intramembrane serine protease n=1 Tax=Ferruginibacter sp. HRS2-29 TaxID=2487334 RepID=UPI0020CD22C8|nr:rhomboid family intramembrane serine protease [Ferruginibacter sp. HRS2-29]MCP9751771.1 rhomboid family intramembrane serine protease [Ferruginibacter sp. HRS2-29]
MPKTEQSFAANADKETMLAVAYEAFTQLKWIPTHAGNQRLLGEEQGKGFQKPRLITVAYDNGKVIVSSETVDDQVFDVGGRNKKNIAALIRVYNEILPGISKEKVQENVSLVDHITAATAETIREQEKTAQEILEVMKFGSGKLYVTYTIIAINVIVFILMIMDGAGIMTANGLVHLKWGSNFGPLTLSGDWWRLITNIFIHFGIIHLLMNMYALYMIGMYLELMLGKVKYATAYVCTGLLASLASLWWHSGTPANSAGASGAVFGMYGLFLAMLTTKLIPGSMRKGLLTNIGIFVAYNLVYGLKGGIDNSAHIGGLLSGCVIGYLFVLTIHEENSGKKNRWVLPLIILVTAGIVVGYLEKNKVPLSEKTAIMREIDAAGYKDQDEFNSKYDTIIFLQKKALEPIQDTNAKFDQALFQKLNTISIPSWQNAEDISISMEKLNVSIDTKKKLKTLQLYIAQRQEEINIIKDIIQNGENETILQRRDSLAQELNNTISTLQSK